MMPAKNILITGGTGFLGNELRQLFVTENYHVDILSRNTSADRQSFQWNLENHYVDPNAFEKTDTIIHLAGVRIAEGRWTEKRKKEIIDSRVQSANLIFENLKSKPNLTKTFISASAIGIYGNTGDEEVDESHSANHDFLGQTCIQWEDAANKFTQLGIRVVILRIGIVLSKDEGALPQLTRPIKLFFGLPFGSGNQFMSWIHISDLCSLFLKAVEDEKMTGVYNAVAPNPVSNKEFIKTLSKILHRSMLPVGVAPFLLRLMLGEKSAILLEGQRVSCRKILNAGFNFQFEILEKALLNIYG